MAKVRAKAAKTKAKPRKAAVKTVKKAVKKAVKKTAKRKSGLTQMVYTVSPELEGIVGSKKLTRPQIIKQLWNYIKKHKCQDTKNRRLIVPDDCLCEVIGKKPVDMLKLAGCISKHIKK